MAKSEGAEVREAIDGPDIDHDQLIAFITARNREDRERSSSAGESRQKIGEFLDETAMNGKALSFLRQIVKTSDKDNGQAKAADIIRSLKVGLPMIENHICGQGTADMDFGDDEPMEPLAEGDGFDDWPDAGQPERPFDPDLAADSDDFDAALAQVDDRVVPFTGTAG
jgi:hypothetical protein